ncbi:hypothetical protein CYMTET_31959 [Cymbomonas tetramitiformis]|uniref:Uncharacterized protein n=1 Tax=Cymbomonas tetramitiformis TaxID=36881 RepID=A0AAE0KSP8_9CHLO|nr:hypothetical protein CYMTET_31959 [Cymbomonas tetramitiformis]
MVSVESHIEPDGVGETAKLSLSDEQWQSMVEEWDSWTVTFQGEIFYFYKKATQPLPPEVGGVTTPLSHFPDTSVFCFKVVLPGIGKGSLPTRGTLKITPEELYFHVPLASGRIPDKLEETLPLMAVVGWYVDEAQGGSVTLYVQTNVGCFDLRIKSANASRLGRCVQAFARQLHDSKKTPEASLPTLLDAQPADYKGKYPLKVVNIDTSTLEQYGKCFGSTCYCPIKKDLIW